MVKQAPFPELVTLPADQLCRHIRKLTSAKVLKNAYFFELEHDRRKSVMDEAENRLRLLDAPLGGPKEPPLPDYESMSDREVLSVLGRRISKRVAADVYAWEYYHGRRRHIMDTAGEVAGQRLADGRVQETAPPRPTEYPEPFPGYKRQRVETGDGPRWVGLSATPQARDEVRSALSAQTPEVLRRTLEYEQSTQRRVIMLKAIRSALREKGALGSD